jgi:hypothetical protein
MFAIIHKAPRNLVGVVDLRGARCIAHLYLSLHHVRTERPVARLRRVCGNVRASFIASYRTFGPRCVWHDLSAEVLLRGLRRVERLLRLHASQCRRGQMRRTGRQTGSVD